MGGERNFPPKDRKWLGAVLFSRWLQVPPQEYLHLQRDNPVPYSTSINYVSSPLHNQTFRFELQAHFPTRIASKSHPIPAWASGAFLSIIGWVATSRIQPRNNWSFWPHNSSPGIRDLSPPNVHSPQVNLFQENTLKYEQDSIACRDQWQSRFAHESDQAFQVPPSACSVGSACCTR